MHAKVLLRRRLLAQRAALTPADVQKYSAAVLEHLCVFPAFCTSNTVMVYMALPQEVQTASILCEARQQQKRVAVPVLHQGRMLAVELPTDTSRLRRGPYGILEPCDHTALVALKDIGCILVPGVAFDRHGGRLGFGQGYYDRFLGQLGRATFLCGLAFGLQLVPCVPQMPHDVRVHAVVTDQGVISCRREASSAVSEVVVL